MGSGDDTNRGDEDVDVNENVNKVRKLNKCLSSATLKKKYVSGLVFLSRPGVFVATRFGRTCDEEATVTRKRQRQAKQFAKDELFM